MSIPSLLARLVRWVLAPSALLALGVALAAALDPHVDLASLAMIFVLVAVIGGLWLPVPGSLLFTAVCVTGFNVAFVPPRGSFTVDLHQHLLLLGGTFVVGLVSSVLMSRLRTAAARARAGEREARQREALAETLSSATETAPMAQALASALDALAPGRCASLVLRGELPPLDDDDLAWWSGSPDADERVALWLATREAQGMGPGTGHHDALPMCILPLKVGEQAWGAVLMRLDRGEQAQMHGAPGGSGELPLAQLRLLAALAGQALQRVHLERQAREARDEARTQAVRSELLAAISHDFRTPLACILGAASSLAIQDDRLSPARRQALLAQIENEARALSTLTENTLQLVRLDGGRLSLHKDWESLPELVGDRLGRQRERERAAGLPPRVTARFAPELPLVWGDGVLLSQLIDNLIDNALKYSEGPVEIVVRPDGEEVLLAVRDRGPGIPPGRRERIFEAFERGTVPAGASRRGAGLGLAVARAVARAHGGSLRVRARGHGGSAFELRLPPGRAPAAQPQEAAADAAQPAPEAAR